MSAQPFYGPTITRPNGKPYRPRKGPEAVLLGYEDEDPSHVLVLRTHDEHAALALAEAAVENYIDSWYGRDSGFSWTITDPEQVWRRTKPAGTDPDDGYSMRVVYADDPDRGVAAVRWTITLTEPAA